MNKLFFVVSILFSFASLPGEIFQKYPELIALKEDYKNIDLIVDPGNLILRNFTKVPSVKKNLKREIKLIFKYTLPRKPQESNEFFLKSTRTENNKKYKASIDYFTSLSERLESDTFTLNDYKTVSQVIKDIYHFKSSYNWVRDTNGSCLEFPHQKENLNLVYFGRKGSPFSRQSFHSLSYPDTSNDFIYHTPIEEKIKIKKESSSNDIAIELLTFSMNAQSALHENIYTFNSKNNYRIIYVPPIFHESYYSKKLYEPPFAKKTFFEENFITWFPRQDISKEDKILLNLENIAFQRVLENPLSINYFPKKIFESDRAENQLRIETGIYNTSLSDNYFLGDQEYLKNIPLSVFIDENEKKKIRHKLLMAPLKSLFKERFQKAKKEKKQELMNQLLYAWNTVLSLDMQSLKNASISEKILMYFENTAKGELTTFENGLINMQALDSFEKESPLNKALKINPVKFKKYLEILLAQYVVSSSVKSDRTTKQRRLESQVINAQILEKFRRKWISKEESISKKRDEIIKKTSSLHLNGGLEEPAIFNFSKAELEGLSFLYQYITENPSFLRAEDRLNFIFNMETLVKNGHFTIHPSLSPNTFSTSFLFEKNKFSKEWNSLKKETRIRVFEKIYHQLFQIDKTEAQRFDCLVKNQRLIHILLTDQVIDFGNEYSVKFEKMEKIIRETENLFRGIEEGYLLLGNFPYQDFFNTQTTLSSPLPQFIPLLREIYKENKKAKSSLKNVNYNLYKVLFGVSATVSSFCKKALSKSL